MRLRRIIATALSGAALAGGAQLALAPSAGAAVTNAYRKCVFDAYTYTPVQTQRTDSGTSKRVSQVLMGTRVISGPGNSEDIDQMQVVEQKYSGGYYNVGPGQVYHFDYRPTVGYASGTTSSQAYPWVTGSLYVWFWLHNKLTGQTCTARYLVG